MLVVVTGGAGFIGSATVELLHARREELGVSKIVIVDNLYSGRLENVSRLLGDPHVVFVKEDIARYDALCEKLGGLLREHGECAIIHLAAIVSIVEALEDPRRTVEVNVMGTANLLELARRFDARRFVFASSVAVYGEPQRLPIDEEHPINPANLYGLTKAMAEGLLERYHQDYGLSAIALRYFNVYGPRMRGGPYAGVIHNFITALLAGRPPTIYGDGKQTRDFVYVHDVAEANILALRSDYNGPMNIGTGVETSIIDLYRIISELLGVRIPPTYRAPRPGDVRRSRADITRAREKLGWEPRTPLRQGLMRTIEYYAGRATASSE